MQRTTFVLMLVLFAAGCGIELPAHYELAEYTRRQLITPQEPDELVSIAPELQQKIADTLFAKFPEPWNWDVSNGLYDGPDANAHGDDYDIYEGFRLYQRHCIHCHGLNGGGNGPTSPFLEPRPRDYRRGTFKWKSTGGNAKPTREDLMLLIKNGAVGTSMPPFKLMPDEDLNNLVDYVVYLSKRGEFERYLMLSALDGEVPDNDSINEYLAGLDTNWAGATESVTPPATPRPDWALDSPELEQSILRGKELFLGDAAGCYKCHGRDGRARPEDMGQQEREQAIDDWGFPSFPRNLTIGLYRGGRRPIDIYRRVHNGIKGTKMPDQATNTKIKKEDLWDLVSFVRALPYRPDLLAPPKTQDDHGHAGHGHAGH